MTVVAWTGLMRRALSSVLAEARSRTLLLISPLSDRDLQLQHDPLMSPILWDLGHIAHFEELWLTRNLSGPIEFSEMPGMFNPFEHPRRERAKLALPVREETIAIMAEIRERVLRKLDAVDLDSDDPLLRDGYAYHMVVQHEYQHNETILQTLQLKTGEPYAPAERRDVPRGNLTLESGAMVEFPAGDVEIGTDDRSVAYDNERPRHMVRLAPFLIDAAPVSNGDFLRFMELGGYQDRTFWSEAGCAWLEEAKVTSPKYWYQEGGRWRTRSMNRTSDIDPVRPVCHVCYHEAEAYATFAGKRLPTEFEWEAAASWDPADGTKRQFPWGDDLPELHHANLDQLAFETAPIGAYAENVSPLGCYGMIGDVWEWTSSDFGGYPGYASFPYPEYSELFFGNEYKVLRGGSWATRSGAVRNTFRNWDYPIRRQIFSGFRCARDA